MVEAGSAALDDIMGSQMDMSCRAKGGERQRVNLKVTRVVAKVIVRLEDI